jgi:DNA-binding NtrC family response regulator
VDDTGALLLPVELHARLFPPADANQPAKAFRIEREGSEPVVVPLYPDRIYTFGRAPESSFVFPSAAVSRLHAQLRFSENRWMFRDLNSRNGCFLVSEPVRSTVGFRGEKRPVGSKEEHAVRAGDVLLLGTNKNLLVFLAEVPEEALSGLAKGHKPSPATARLDRGIEVCARHRLPVFLLGGSGTGKTHVARTIHERSRMSGTFIMLNCGRLPHDPAQLTSELLGHVRGSFSGAVSERKGKLWAADQGTFFLDEVESLPRPAQDFLIDVLEGSGNYAPYGAPGDEEARRPLFRLISASKVPLSQTGLRPDLTQRIAAGDMLAIPTLEERREDIPALAEAFLKQLEAEQRIQAEVTPEAVQWLKGRRWPGQIRELESTIRVVVCREHASQQLDGARPQSLVVGTEPFREYLEHRELGFGFAPKEPFPMEATATGVKAHRKRPADLTREEVLAAVEAHGGNKTRAAASLGIALNTLKSKLAR